MKGAFDEIMATTIKRQHEPRALPDLHTAGISEKQARAPHSKSGAARRRPTSRKTLLTRSRPLTTLQRTGPTLLPRSMQNGLGNDPAILKILPELGRQKAHTYGKHSEQQTFIL
jgi:hypothetical protein